MARRTARDRGPVEKLERREGVNLGLKGRRAVTGKSALERRPYPPGERGRRRQRVPNYAEQLREKQRAKRFYGLRENQLRRIFQRAPPQVVLGNELLTLLELRLDNVVECDLVARRVASVGRLVSNFCLERVSIVGGDLRFMT